MQAVFLKKYKIRKNAKGLVVTLPREFANEHRLEAGMELDAYKVGEVLLFQKATARP